MNVVLEKLSALNDKSLRLRQRSLPGIKGLFSVYKINIQDLKFNPYNDRLTMEIKGYERENKRSLGFDDVSQNFLFQALRNLHKQRNKQTWDDIVIKGLVRPVVVNSFGVVLDGNRRVAILREKIGEFEQNDKYKHLENIEVVVVESESETVSKREIQKWETSLQMDEDPKLEYDPINIYLKISRLVKDVSNEKDKYLEVAKQMGPRYKSNDIKNYYELYQNEMSNYLDYFKSSDNPLLLKGREDHFKTFRNGFNQKIKKNEFNSEINYEDSKEDYELAKKVLYALISIFFEGKAFRTVFPKKTKTFLSTKEGLNCLHKYLQDNEIFKWVMDQPSMKIFQEENMKSLKKFIKELNAKVREDNPNDDLKIIVEKLEKNSEKIYNFSTLNPNKVERSDLERLSKVKDKLIQLISNVEFKDDSID